MGWLKPKPQDDASIPPGLAFANNEAIGGYDDDSSSIRPASFLSRLLGAVRGTPVAPIIPGYATMDGPYFRAGYFAYSGVGPSSMQQAESDVTIGRPTILRPPIIPRRSVQPISTAFSLRWIQAQPYITWAPIIPPPVSRR